MNDPTKSVQNWSERFPARRNITKKTARTMRATVKSIENLTEQFYIPGKSFLLRLLALQNYS